MTTSADYARKATISATEWEHRVATNPSYPIQDTFWHKALLALEAESKPPVPPPPVVPPPADSLAPYRNLCVMAQNPLDALKSHPRYRILWTCDPAYDSYATRSAADATRNAGHEIGVWYVPTEVSKARADEVAARLGTTFVLGQCETADQFNVSTKPPPDGHGRRAMVGNLGALTDAQLAAVRAGTFYVVNEDYWNCGGGAPDWHNANAGVPGNCIAVYEDGQCQRKSVQEYIAAGRFNKQTDSVYGVGLTDAGLGGAVTCESAASSQESADSTSASTGPDGDTRSSASPTRTGETCCEPGSPGVPVYEDVRQFGDGEVGGNGTSDHALREGLQGRHDIDLLCGGFPCQDVSVAGRRAGLDGARSGLFHEFARIADALRPRLLLVENVPGLLSSNGGRDFGVVLGTLADLGYGVGWRIVDSRFFGVPQRRRRVFIVGVLADGDPRAAAERAGEILAVGTRCDRHLAARTEAGSNASPTSVESTDPGGIAGPLMAMGGKNERGYRIGVEEASSGFIVPQLAPSLQASQAIGDPSDQVAYVIASPLSHGSNPNSNMAGRRREDDVNLVIAGPLSGGNDGIGRRSEDDPNLVSFTSRGREGGAQTETQTDGLHPALRSGRGGGRRDSGIAGPSVGVRRLTPTECERLQALPDGWTDLGGTSDSRRYAALGDAVTVSVAEWIGRRLLIHVKARAA